MYEASISRSLFCSEVWDVWEKACVTDSRDCKTGFLRIILKHCFSDYNGIPLSKYALSSSQLVFFKSLNKLYPEGLKNVFKPTYRVHSYNIKGISNNIFVVTACTGKSSAIVLLFQGF